MKDFKKDSFQDYKLALLKDKKRYLLNALMFKQELLEHKGENKLRKGKKIRTNY